MFPILFPIKRSDFSVMSPSAIHLSERFWCHVSKTEGCWNWTSRLSPKGYGKFKFPIKKLKPGRENKRHGEIRAHRLSWLLHRGEIPEGLCVLHRCDNRKCVRPDHLFLGDDQDNHDDAIEKGRKGQIRGKFAKTEELQRIRSR